MVNQRRDVLEAFAKQKRDDLNKQITLIVRIKHNGLTMGEGEDKVELTYNEVREMTFRKYQFIDYIQKGWMEVFDADPDKDGKDNLTEEETEQELPSASWLNDRIDWRSV